MDHHRKGVHDATAGTPKVSGVVYLHILYI